MGADKKEKELKESFAKKEEQMRESLAKKDDEMKESFAKKMLAAGKPQDEVAEFSGLSKTTIAKLAKVI
ncbi:MAG: hypothetical protein IJ708_01095, partial [Clostridia bacterium]|nr:hypothetical protein [Clostridia bacterium]